MSERPRLTIGRTMAGVAFTAAGLAALRYPSWLVANLVFTVALVVMFVGLLALVSVPSGRRPYWRGFAISGWGYLILSVGPGTEGTTSPRLATTVLLDLFYEQVYGGYPYPQLYHRAIPYHAVGQKKGNLWSWPEPIMSVHNDAFYVMSPTTYLLIGHSLFSLPIAMAGGALGRRLARRPTSDDAPNPGEGR